MNYWVSLKRTFCFVAPWISLVICVKILQLIPPRQTNVIKIQCECWIPSPPPSVHDIIYEQPITSVFVCFARITLPHHHCPITKTTHDRFISRPLFWSILPSIAAESMHSPSHELPCGGLHSHMAGECSPPSRWERRIKKIPHTGDTESLDRFGS